MVRRALFLLLVFAPLAWAQSLECDAQEVRFDFSENVSGGLTAPDGVFYPRAGLPGYLSFLEAPPPSQLFLPTQVVGTQNAFITCLARPARSGRGGRLCGVGSGWCLRLRVSGSLSPPLANSRVYVLGRRIPGTAINYIRTPTPLGSIPDNGGLFGLPPGAPWSPPIPLEIWILLELSASDSYTGLYSGSLLFTYVIEDD